MSHRRGDWGNRSFSQQPFQGGGGGVDPWGQGSAMDNQRALLSQITSNPQQLALALTSLLQPQDHNPPSLLSLNTSSGMSGNYYNTNSSGRLGAGGRGRDFRRHEPYNRNRNSGGFRDGAKGRNKRSKDKKDGKDKKKDEKKTDAKKDENADTTVDLSVDEDKDETKESKRDWKDEKNQNDEKNESDAEGDKTKDDPAAKEGKYVGVPIEYLNCFVCNKVMWDGVSMWKHVKGKAHSQMLKSLEENIHITVNVLRENMRLNEEKKVIERSRMRRFKRSRAFDRDFDSHCNMCDLKILGKISAHRRSPAHQRLKRYLHPDCDVCSKEFHWRIDWIEHRLTPEHLKKLTETNDGKVGGFDGKDIFKIEEDFLEPLLEEALEMEAENPVLELDAPLDNLQNMMPAYKKDRPIATKSLESFSGFMCSLCHRAFETEEVAQEHLKTQRHFQKFVSVIKEKHREENLKKDKKEAAEKKALEEAEKNGEDTEMYNPEDVTNEDEENDESAVKDEDISMDTSQLQNEDELLADENGKDNVEEMEADKEEAILNEVKVEEVVPAPPPAPVVEVKKPVAPTPAATRATQPKRNVAGPKSKKVQPVAVAAAIPAAAKSGSYRIPKVANTKSK